MTRLTLDLIMDYYGKVATHANLLEYHNQKADTSKVIQVKNLLVKQFKGLSPVELRTIYDERYLANDVRINQMEAYESVGLNGVGYLTAERRSEMNLLQILHSVRYDYTDLGNLMKFFQEEKSLLEFIDIYSDFLANAKLRHLNPQQKQQVSKVKAVADYMLMIKLANMSQEEMVDFVRYTANYRQVYKKRALQHKHQVEFLDECFSDISPYSAGVIEHNNRSLQKFYHQQNYEKLTNEEFGVIAMMDKAHNFCYSNIHASSVEGM